MEPIHLITEKDNISPLVLMPGDPLRAKYIAEKFLEDAKLINRVRNMYGFTGYYKGVKVTIMASGMGIPSMGIYSYELAHFYDVKKIIRIGSAGSLSKNVKIKDLVVATEAKSLSTFGIAMSDEAGDTKYPSEDLLQKFREMAPENVHFGPILTSDTFDLYSGIDHVLARLDFRNPLAIEMETFALFHIGKMENIDTASILTIVDSVFEPESTVPAIDRERALNDMIILALEVLIK